LPLAPATVGRMCSKKQRDARLSGSIRQHPKRCAMSSTRIDAIACGQLYNVVLRAVSVGLKVHDTQVLEARVEELERLLETREDSEARAKPWG
jgi:hypothetical protein